MIARKYACMAIITCICLRMPYDEVAIFPFRFNMKAVIEYISISFTASIYQDGHTFHTDDVHQLAGGCPHPDHGQMEQVYCSI